MKSFGKESGYYPPGAEFDPNAPWNQDEDGKHERAVETAEQVARNLLCNGTELRFFDRDYELLMNISPHALADIFREVDLAKTSPLAMIRLLHACEVLRGQMVERMVPQLMEAV